MRVEQEWPSGQQAGLVPLLPGLAEQQLGQAEVMADSMAGWPCQQQAAKQGATKLAL